MDTVPPLKFVSKLVCIQALFKHLDEEDSDHLSEYITRLLETGCFTAVSEKILHRIIQYFPEKLNNRLLKALLPPHTKDLNLAGCHHVSLMGLVDILKKCSHLQKLNLTGCTQLMVPDIFTCMGLMGLQITTICVEGNQNVTDDIVQTMIRTLPGLYNLDISCCPKITDDVFLVEKEIQLRRETSKQTLTGALSEYKYKLSSVDISGCGGITSVAVRHLTSLSGPHLRHVSISFTKIDSTALFSLAGYSFPAIIDFILNGDETLLKEKELKEYVSDLTEIADVYGIQVKNKGNGVDAKASTKDTNNTKQNATVVEDLTPSVSSQDAEIDKQDLNFEELSLTKNDLILYQKTDGELYNQGTQNLRAESELLESDTDSSEGEINILGSELKVKSETVMVKLGLPPLLSNEKLASENDDVLGYMQGLSLKECGYIDELTSDHDDEVLSESKLPAGLSNFTHVDKNDLKFVIESDKENRNSNRHDVTSFKGSPSSKSDLTQTPEKPKLLVNNYMNHADSAENSSTVLDAPKAVNQAELKGTEHSIAADTELSCSECINNKEFIDSVSKVQNKGLQHNDLNKNLICDINVDHRICDVTMHDEKLSLNMVKTHSSCDIVKPFDSLGGIESVSRNATEEVDISCASDPEQRNSENSHLLDYKFTEGKTEHSTSGKNEFVKTMEDEIYLVEADISTGVNNSDIASEKDAYLSENTSYLEDSACNEMDDTKLRQGQVHLEVDTNGSSEQCNQCRIIKEKLLSIERVGNNTCEVTNTSSCKTEKQEDDTLDSEINSDSANDNLQESENSLSRSVKDKIDDIKNKLDTIDEKLSAFTQTDEQPVQLYIPNLTSLNIENIKFPSKLLGKLCLEKFFQLNKNLRSFKVNWKGLYENIMKSLLPSLSNLQEISVEECTWLQSGGVGAIGQSCPDLKNVNLRGVVFIKDMAMAPYLVLPELTSLDLAESEITDTTLIRLANRCSDKLTQLDLSWCEEITERGVNEICSKCSKLEVLILKKCPVSDITLSLMAENCRYIRGLTIESVEDVTKNILSDAGISEMGQNLRYLQKLDISWNLSITDVSINVIMSQCIMLEEAYMKGLKQITGEAFFPIIADFLKWQKCQALLKFKKHEREYLQAEGEEPCSSDEEYEALMIPHRSRSYAPNLRVLDLEYSDLVEDERMMEIVSVCRGSLKVIDYYGQELRPRLFIKK